MHNFKAYRFISNCGLTYEVKVVLMYILTNCGHIITSLSENVRKLSPRHIYIDSLTLLTESESELYSQ